MTKLDRAVMSFGSGVRRGGGRLGVIIVAFLTLTSVVVAKPPTDESTKDIEPPNEVVEKIRGIEKAAQDMGPWDGHYMVMEEATDNVFQQNGWDSEPDQYARQLVREVGRIPPWKAMERQEVFLNSVQQRLKLTDGQRSLFDEKIRAKTIPLAMKHLSKTLPIAMEVIKTRSANEPFTAEQVQRWSRNLKPIMDDALETLQEITGELESTMTPEQKALLKKDMDALLRRHHDVEKMVERWQKGEWSPQDWGLQNDAVHVAAARTAAAEDSEKDRLVREAEIRDNPNDPSIATHEDAWDAYVKWFCDFYQCDEAQRGKAEAILSDCKQQAIDHRAARKERIERHEREVAAAESPAVREAAQAALDKELAPIGAIFNRLKQRLYPLLTAKQRQIGGSGQSVDAPKAATGQSKPPSAPPTQTADKSNAN